MEAVDATTSHRLVARRSSSLPSSGGLRILISTRRSQVVDNIIVLLQERQSDNVLRLGIKCNFSKKMYRTRT